MQRKKWFRAFTLVSVSVYILFFCFTGSCYAESGDSCMHATEVIRDIRFKNGLAVSPLSPDIVQKGGGFEKTNTDTLLWEKQDSLPVWQLAQWYSRYDLAKSPLVIGTDGSRTYGNPGKSITRFSDGSLLLRITTSTEYEEARKADEPWPHLLIQQDFAKPLNPGRAKALRFHIELRVVECINKMKPEEYDEHLHTAQSPFYFFIRNSNQDSEDYGLSLWLGISSFDYRYDSTRKEEYVQWDKGTKMYIYVIPETDIWGDVSFQDGRWHTADTDILPFLQKALERIKDEKIFLHTSISDLEITGMNFGWEVPGTFDAALQVRGISLKMME